MTSACAAFRPLFNGADLAGWYTFLEGHGLDRDPDRVFQVHDGILHVYKDHSDGAPAPLGYLGTRQELGNYHLRLEYRWGEKRFGRRAREKRDSGLLYHLVGPDRIWPRAVELQIQEGDTGDLFTIATRMTTTVGPDTIRTDLRIAEAAFRDPGEGGISHTQGGKGVMRIVKRATHEVAGWNTVELIVRGDSAVHIVNGRETNRCSAIGGLDADAPDPGGWVKLERGRVLLQAEWAEVMYRNVQIRPL